MKLKTKDQLGFKYFVVKKDDSQDFKDYINWLNRECYWKFEGSDGPYYGYDGNSNCNGANCHYNKESFINNPKLFTAKEFMDILREDETLYLEPNTYAVFDTNKLKSLFDRIRKESNKGLGNYFTGEKILHCLESGLFMTKSKINSLAKAIPPEEFELRLNNTLNKMNNTKKIIGYKTPCDLFEGNIKKGDLYITSSNNNIYYPKHKQFMQYGLPKEIVETWEPIYESQEVIYDMGSFKLRITPTGIMHNTDDITKFVKELVGSYSPNNEYISYGGYNAIRKDVIFSQTGCEKSETKLSQWTEVWNKYQSIKN